MKAIRSKLAEKVLHRAFYDSHFAKKLAHGKPFGFDGKIYIQQIVRLIKDIS